MHSCIFHSRMPELPVKVREIIESCTSKRMVTSILALMVFCVLILMLEEIAEESETKGDFDVKTMAVSEKSKEEAKVDESCYERESFTLLQSCVQCTDFEKKAIKSNHCVSTGFYDRLRCTTSGSLSFRPCTPGIIFYFFWYILSPGPYR
ncbi:jtr-1 [Pristionchus pacificus]|uniref:Protein JTB n=1 Tax=Pristionchus pacificus TaxID=54126 RepID=A0A2A6BFK1_PRIPA|nr:jtr-1 [Pristionchus pacificus]|eukprot:PDM64695.1 jtr-1 [Pristionchus pacificus]